MMKSRSVGSGSTLGRSMYVDKYMGLLMCLLFIIDISLATEHIWKWWGKLKCR